MNRIERNKSRSRKRRRKARRRALKQAHKAAAAWKASHGHVCKTLDAVKAGLARALRRAHQAAISFAYAIAARDIAEHRAACAERETAMRRQGAERIEA
jgi:hypothetical protein